jgi:hypothetical protein
LAVVVNGCESGTVTLREEYKLTVFENKVLGKIFRPERKEVRGVWGRLYIKELYDL